MTETKPVNMLDELLKWRDEWREMMKHATLVVDGEKQPLENNRMGFYRWYLHPSKQDIGSRTTLVWIQEIPPGSRSGKQKSQGGQAIIVLEGRGYTVIDDIRYDWKQYDTIWLPLLPDGTVHQHFNADPDDWAKLLCTEPNFIGALGVDKGAGFEILEDSPDYRPQG